MSFRTLILLLLSFPLFSQNVLILEHQTKHKRHKRLPLRNIYEVHVDSTVYRSKIVGVSDSSIQLTRLKRDPLSWERFTKKIDGQWVTGQRHPMRPDTFEVALRSIDSIVRRRIRHHKALPFRGIAKTALYGVILIPPLFVTDDGVKLRQYLFLEGFLFAISLPVLIIETWVTVYDMRVWKIKRREVKT